MANGRLDVEPIIGGIWPISEWQTAFEEMHSGAIVKSVLKPV
jgi:alcohol dehydrogenase/L-iditol 2-dehydrogenase